MTTLVVASVDRLKTGTTPALTRFVRPAAKCRIKTFPYRFLAGFAVGRKSYKGDDG